MRLEETLKEMISVNMKQESENWNFIVSEQTEKIENLQKILGKMTTGKTTLETSGKDVEIHSKRVEKM